MEPITMALVITYFLFRRGGENVMWLARKDGSDPPSFRRWQERQKRRGRRASAAGGRAEARKFWSGVWHDAHASAHEWRQRKHGRRLEERRKRWQKEDVERQQHATTAPCVFCGAGRDEPCSDTCPELEAHTVDRATTVPPETSRTTPSGSKPGRATAPDEPAKTARTVPPAPSQPGTVPDDRATGTEPAAPDHARSATPTKPRQSAPPSHATGPAKPAKGGTSADGATLLASYPCPDCGAIAEEWKKGSYVSVEIEHHPHCRNSSDHTDKTPSNVTPINRVTAADSTGGNMTTPATPGTRTPTPTGEFTGYEATIAGWEQIQRLTAELDTVYETQMAALRAEQADAQTIGKVAQAREANETHMHAATEARNDWQTRQGAVKEAKDATGARGNEALHVN